MESLPLVSSRLTKERLKGNSNYITWMNGTKWDIMDLSEELWDHISGTSLPVGTTERKEWKALNNKACRLIFHTLEDEPKRLVGSLADAKKIWLLLERTY